MLLTNFLLPFRSYKYLLFQLTGREIKARYKQSFIGYAWVILNPLAQILVYSFVFSIVFRFPTNGLPYVVFLYSALLPWTFFQSASSSATQSLVENASLLKKVSFPREVTVYASIFAKIIDTFVASVFFLLLLIILRVQLAPTAPIFLLLFAIQLIFTTGIGLALATLNLFYCDIQYLTNLLMMLWMYMTPIVYPLSLVPPQYVYLYKLNPMVSIIEGYRAVLFGYHVEWKLIIYSAIVSFVFFIFVFTLFKKAEKLFADVV